MRVLLLSSIFLSFSTILLSSLGLSCPVTVPTVSYVSRCPSNESEWESAAQQKQCNKLATLQSCTDPEKFVYHCVLNKDGTKYLEVCAQFWFMSGFCARFSVADGRIINDPGLDCTAFSTPCPSRFLSNESFKYQGCYEYLQQSTPSNIIDKKTPSSERESYEEESCSVVADFEEESKNANKITITSERADDDDKENDKVMNFRTLSGLQGRCSVRNVTVISELRDNLSIALSEQRQNVWVVQEDKGILYNDETPFTELEKLRKQIEVMIGNSKRSVGRKYGGKEPTLDVISKRSEASQKSRMSCKYFTEPENLFNYTKENIFGGNAEVKCPKCNALWEMEELVTKSNMSPDEQIFFGKAMFINTQAN
ncbi:uncharacterized protein LOC134236518 [Saccostrea cucullata]|uniref:uncharacterized protein LOC134236518 n=1 Tax=Saccostrea cuccullata TaxID=36930 RepID=UPI002ED61684